MKKENLAVIRAIAIRNTEDYSYVPIQISVVRYENGKLKEQYESIVNPVKSIKNSPDIPRYLNEELLEQAPLPQTVADIVWELTKDCVVEADAAAKPLLRKLQAV